MDKISIAFPEGGCWEARGYGVMIDESTASSIRASGGGQALALLNAIQPVLDAEPGEEPHRLPNGYTIQGWDGDALIYTSTD